MGMVFVAQTGIEDKAVLRERAQELWGVESVLYDKARHTSSASLGIHRHNFELCTLIDIEVGLHYSYLFLHALPVKEMLKLLGSQMEQHAVVGFDTRNESVGQPLFPPCEERLSVAQGGLSVAGGCRCLTKDGNTSIEKEGYIPYPLQA